MTLRTIQQIALAGAIILALGACSSNEEPPVKATDGQAANGHSMPMTDSPHGVADAGQDAAHSGVDISASAKSGTTVVPEHVAGKWRAATFIVVDRNTSAAEEVTIELKGEHVFPDGDLKFSVIEFLPDLRIDNNIYTSVTNDPNNPAAHVRVTEGGKEVFDGWLFSEFPQVHRFEHPRFGITLKEGVPK